MFTRHFCFWIAAFVGICTFVAARAQELKIIGIRGDCHTELNSTDLGCADARRPKYGTATLVFFFHAPSEPSFRRLNFFESVLSQAISANCAGPLSSDLSLADLFYGSQWGSVLPRGGVSFKPLCKL